MFGHFRRSRIRKTVSTWNADCRYCRPRSKCRLRTRCRLSSMQNADWQEKLFFLVVRNVLTFDFIKFSFSGNPLAYGTAEADEMIASQAAPGRGEAMHPWGILRGVTRYILGWGGAARPLTWPRHWMNSFSLHLKCTFKDRKLSTFPTNGKTVRWLHDNR